MSVQNTHSQIISMCGQCYNMKWRYVKFIIETTSWQNQQSGICAQRRLRSTWTSTQSDQSLRCPPEESLGPKLPITRTAKTLIRLSGCPGWSESSLGAHATLLVLSWYGSYYEKATTKNTSSFHISYTTPSGKGADRDKMIYDNTNRMPLENSSLSVIWPQICEEREMQIRRWSTTKACYFLRYTV